jgi:23S rRNA (adenine1618-N6)-methyltransferase
MFSKEESRKLREDFWISFGKSFPRKWLLYNTKIKGLSFKFYFDTKKAFVSLDLEDDLENRINCWEKLEALKGILHSDEQITFVMCNPPFHASAEEAKKATLRKLRNLKGKNHNKATLNFGGQHNELWCKGGESRFIKDLIYESSHFSKQCKWFTTLVSKESTLKGIYTDLKKVKAKEVKTIDMGQGQKISRIVAWSFE